MKLITVLSSLLLAGVATAEIQSKPFHLVLRSANQHFDGKQLLPCHTGAAIESLCVYGNSGARYHFNTTKGDTSPVKGYTPSGVLTWNLPLSNSIYIFELFETHLNISPGPGYVSEPMSFYYDPSTNVAMPLFEPGYTTQYVTWDQSNGEMAIFDYLNDRVTPPTDAKVYVLKNWYVCETNFEGYTYTTLNWAMGYVGAKPQNPSCVKVEVQRRFIA